MLAIQAQTRQLKIRMKRLRKVLLPSTTLFILSVSSPPLLTRSHTCPTSRFVPCSVHDKLLNEGITQGYMKAVKAKLGETKPDRVEAFEKGAAAYAKKIVANFKDFEFVST